MPIVAPKYGLFKWTLRTKVNLVVGINFLLVIIFVSTYTVKRETNRLLELTEAQTKDLTTFYFDSLNTMMLTDTMDKRSILRNKALARPEVIEARVIRGQPVIQQFGPGLPEEVPLDDMDYRALKGESISLIETRGGKRVWTAITPFRATEDTRGVNCLNCHKVPTGSINGAIRISLSLDNVDAAVEKEMWNTIWANFGLLAVALIIVNLLLQAWFINPLTGLLEVIRRRGEGDIYIRANISNRDEIGDLAAEFNTMADNVNYTTEREHQANEELSRKVQMLLDVINKVTEGQYDVRVGFRSSDAIGELADNLQIMITYIKNSIDEKKQAVEVLREKVARILTVVEQATNGDLTGQISITGADAISHLADGVQDMISSLNTLVSQVQRSGIQVASSATEIAATAKQQEATISEQAATTSEIAVTATEISATAKELEKTMDQVAGVAESTTGIAEDGQASLARMQTTMKRVVDAASGIANKLEILNEKAANIGTVVDTINRVADQTNLLSLNAAIEAEKAGEYGYGFSVVAREIRRLADQTAVATLDIEQIVREMQSAVSAGVMSMDKFSEQVRHSVDNVNQASGQLARIIDGVQALTPRFESVHQSMHFQTQGALQINNAMNSLNESAHQTVESLQQSNAAIERLNEAAHSLQHAVSIFKVRRD